MGRGITDQALATVLQVVLKPVTQFTQLEKVQFVNLWFGVKANLKKIVGIQRIHNVSLQKKTWENWEKPLSTIKGKGEGGEGLCSNKSQCKKETPCELCHVNK